MMCNHINSIVVDSRKDEVNGVINRTRVCKKCGARFHTTEYLAGNKAGEIIAELSGQVTKLNEEKLQLDSKLYQIKRILADKG